jgi:hypothetical protein
MDVARHGRAWLCDVILRARPTSFPLSGSPDWQLAELLKGLVASADLVLVRESAEGGGDGDSSSVKQQRLVRKIEAKLRHPLSHAGRRYRLVADTQLQRLPGRDVYVVVGRSDAARILDAVAGQSDPSLADLLGQARDLLSRDWRPPLVPDGLVLLRRTSEAVAPAPLEPAMTPSQLAKLMEPKLTFTLSLRVEGPARLSAAVKVDGPPRFDVAATVGDSAPT